MRAPAGSAKSLLPLIEIIISVLIFAIAAMLSLKIFLLSRDLGIKAEDTTAAVFAAQSAVEHVKSARTQGELIQVLHNEFNANEEQLSGLTQNTTSYIVSYDSSWVADGQSSPATAYFALSMEIQPLTEANGTIFNITVNVVRNKPYAFLANGTELTPQLVSLHNSKYISGRAA